MPDEVDGSSIRDYSFVTASKKLGFSGSKVRRSSWSVPQNSTRQLGGTFDS
jgi:hypothetical protein